MSQEWEKPVTGLHKDLLLFLWRSWWYELCTGCFLFSYVRWRVLASQKGLGRAKASWSYWNLHEGLHSTLHSSFGVSDQEDSCPSGSSGKVRGLPRIFLNVCTLHLVPPFGYMMEKVPALQKDLGKSRGLPRAFSKVPCPCSLLDLYESLYSALGPSFGNYDKQGLCLSGRSGEGQGPSQDFLECPFVLSRTFVKVTCSSWDLHECVHSVLSPSFCVYDRTFSRLMIP